MCHATSMPFANYLGDDVDSLRVLEAMIGAEEYEKQIKSAEAALKETEQRVTAAVRALDQEEAAVKKEAAELTAKRDGLRTGIAGDMLETYDRIARASEELPRRGKYWAA